MDAFFQFTKAFNFSMYSDLLLSALLCIYQSFLSTYKDIIGKLSIHHIMFFAYGSFKEEMETFFRLVVSTAALLKKMESEV
jgi:hypothetical protein